MSANESRLPEDWHKKGALDLNRVEILLEHGDPEGAAFHLQQAIEKYLKGYLIGKGWKLARIHDLEDLLDFAVDFDAGLEQYRPLCQEVTEYYIEERYPIFPQSGIAVEDVRDKINTAKDLINKLAG